MEKAGGIAAGFQDSGSGGADGDDALAARFGKVEAGGGIRGQSEGFGV